jgi:hypothetical protein
MNSSTLWQQTSQTLISAYQIARRHILEYSSSLMTHRENLQISRAEHSSVVFSTSSSVDARPLC